MPVTWNHNQCYGCWEALHPFRQAVCLKVESLATCCSCGRLTASGILVRHDPKDEMLLCKGDHAEEAEKI